MLCVALPCPGGVQHLPDDTLYLIFSFVPMRWYAPCACVCRGWADLTRNQQKDNQKTAESLFAQELDMMRHSDDFARSLCSFDKALATYPRLATASWWKAWLLFSTQRSCDLDAVFRCCSYALRLQPTGSVRFKLEACQLLVQGEWRLAAALLEDGLKKHPKDPEMHCELGFIYGMGAEPIAPKDAILHFTLALGFEHCLPEMVFTLRSRVFWNQEMHTEALKDLNTALNINPLYAKALCWRGHFYALNGMATEANQDFNNVIAYSTNPGCISRAYSGRAFCQPLGGPYEDDLQQSRCWDASNVIIPVDWVAIGVTKALECLTEAIESCSGPSCCRLYERRALLYVERHDYELAFWDYARALNIAETMPFFAGDREARKRQYREAVASVAALMIS